MGRHPLSSSLVALEDSPYRVDAMRGCGFSWPLVVFETAHDLLAWLPVHADEVALLTLDYHLGPSAEVGTGLDVARFLASQAPCCPIVLHSSDPSGRAAMAQVLRDAGWTVEQFPFDTSVWARAVTRLLAEE